mgnify:CR=1 FL=1
MIRMKGIIVAKNNETSVLLLSDGTFKTVKTAEGFEVGMVLFVNDVLRPRSYYWKKIAYMAASVVLVVFIGLGAFAWSTPIQFIDIDINPSVELSVNYFDRIISVNALNEDGKKLMESVNVQAHRYESGIELVISTAQNMGYINDEEDVLISISSSNPKRVEKAQNDIREKVSPSVEILTFDTQQREQSIQKGISPGKDNIIEKVIEIGTDIDKEELTKKPVKELMKIIRENKKSEQEEKKEEKENDKDNKKDKKSDNDKPGKGNEKAVNLVIENGSGAKPGKDNGKLVNLGKGSENSGKPGKEKDKKVKPDKENDDSDKPGKGNDDKKQGKKIDDKSGKGDEKIIKPVDRDENIDKPGEDKKVKPDKKNDDSDKPGKGNDDKKQGNKNDDKPGKGDEKTIKPGNRDKNNDKPGKEKDKKIEPDKGNDNSDKPGKDNGKTIKPGNRNENNDKPGKEKDKKVRPDKGKNNNDITGDGIKLLDLLKVNRSSNKENEDIVNPVKKSNKSDESGKENEKITPGKGSNGSEISGDGIKIIDLFKVNRSGGKPGKLNEK